MRITRQQAFMETAHVWAKRSTCFRLNVGAVCVVNNRVVSHGYNGSPPGEPHCLGDICPGRHGCRLTIHAEVNALNFVPQSLKETWKDLYVTHSPCPECVTILGRSKIRNVYYGTAFRDTSGLDYLPILGINVYQVMPSGYIIDHFSRGIISE